MVKGQIAQVCECCGHPLPTFNTLRGLTPKQQEIFDALDKAGQAGLARHQLMHALYGNDPNGGPEYQGVLNVQRVKMKEVLAEHGMQIVTTVNRRWRLEKIGWR